MKAKHGSETWKRIMDAEHGSGSCMQVAKAYNESGSGKMREIALHILDIAQNSIAAKASVVTIDIKEDSGEDTLRVSITDNGKGMSAETVEKVIDPFYTTRTTRKVGLGLPMLRQVALACEGSFEIDSQPGRGTKVSVSYKRSHIDRPPLGDMASTMLTILLGNEVVDYVYSHSAHGRVFSFESREMKELLEGVSFQTLEVYDWLKGFLTEGERSLTG
jgi:anti-sigma regulatory factor (Ser/Thr protein kinase)